MAAEIIRKTIRVGNSAGVLLPKEWLNTEVKVILQPLDIEKDILDILMSEDRLRDVQGIYLTGSYARGQETIESDIDVLVITNKTNGRINNGRYDLLFVSRDEVENQLNNNALPILAMLKESKTIMNDDLIKDYFKTQLSWKNLKWHIDSTEKMMDEVLEDIEFAKKTNNLVSDASAYSLVLRLRTLYIIDCLKNNKIYLTKGLLDLIINISGRELAYERYKKSKNYNTLESLLPIIEAERLREYIIKKNASIKKWLKEKKD